MGRSFIASKNVTDYTTKGEEEGFLDTFKGWNRSTIEASAVDAGATCKLWNRHKYSVQLVDSHSGISPPGH
jgi:hypothetical protein